MTHSEQIGELAAALSAAQGEVRGATKDSENPHFRQKYADLASVWDACRDAMAKHGLAVAQFPESGDGATVTVVTTLTHKSGQWMSGSLTMKPAKADPQGIGSCITYARRYALAAAVGVAPEDDDGNAATGNGSAPPAARQVAPRQEAKPPATNGAAKTTPKAAFLAKVQQWSGVRKEDTLDAARLVKKACGIARDATDADFAVMSKWMDEHTFAEASK